MRNRWVGARTAGCEGRTSTAAHEPRDRPPLQRTKEESWAGKWGKTPLSWCQAAAQQLAWGLGAGTHRMGCWARSGSRRAAGSWRCWGAGCTLPQRRWGSALQRGAPGVEELSGGWSPHPHRSCTPTIRHSQPLQSSLGAPPPTHPFQTSRLLPRLIREGKRSPHPRPLAPSPVKYRLSSPPRGICLCASRTRKRCPTTGLAGVRDTAAVRG